MVCSDFDGSKYSRRYALLKSIHRNHEIIDISSLYSVRILTSFLLISMGRSAFQPTKPIYYLKCYAILITYRSWFQLKMLLSWDISSWKFGRNHTEFKQNRRTVRLSSYESSNSFTSGVVQFHRIGIRIRLRIGIRSESESESVCESESVWSRIRIGIGIRLSESESVLPPFWHFVSNRNRNRNGCFSVCLESESESECLFFCLSRIGIGIRIAVFLFVSNRNRNRNGCFSVCLESESESVCESESVANRNRNSFANRNPNSVWTH